MEVCDLIDRPDADTGWSTRTIDDARLICHEQLRRIELGDLSRVRDLELLFAPTGLLQEASMASGWADRYLALSKRFDGIVERSGTRANRRSRGELSDPAGSEHFS